MILRTGAAPILVVALTLLSACGGWKLGAGTWGPIGVDGVYVCYGERPIDPANCSPAIVYVCNSNNAARTAVVESYFSFGDSETREVTVQVPANATAGVGPFLGFSDYKRLSGQCSTRQYLLKRVQ